MKQNTQRTVDTKYSQNQTHKLLKYERKKCMVFILSFVVCTVDKILSVFTTVALYTGVWTTHAEQHDHF